MVRGRVSKLLSGALDKFKQRDQDREEELNSRLAAFHEKQRKKCVPELRLALKGFWTNVEMDCGIKRKEKGWYSFRDDPVVKRRRLTRSVEFERIDEYKEDGEPDFAAQERKRRLRVTVQV